MNKLTSQAMGAGNKTLTSHALLSLLVGWALELVPALRQSASGWHDSLIPTTHSLAGPQAQE